jgi:hypothetical protein
MSVSALGARGAGFCHASRHVGAGSPLRFLGAMQRGVKQFSVNVLALAIYVRFTPQSGVRPFLLRTRT